MVVDILLRAVSVSGLIVVLDHHVHLDWWEGTLLGFCSMMLLGAIYDLKR